MLTLANRLHAIPPGRARMTENQEILAVIVGVLSVFGGVTVAVMNGAFNRLSQIYNAAQKKEEATLTALQFQLNQALTRIGVVEAELRSLQTDLESSRGENQRLRVDLVLANAKVTELSQENTQLKAHALDLERDRVELKGKLLDYEHRETAKV